MITIKRLAQFIGTLVLTGVVFGQAFAALILCSTDTTKNHMKIDNTQVNACIASGIGNINGNIKNDDFLTTPAGTGFTFVGKSDGTNPFSLEYDQNGNWSFDSSYWDNYGDGSIGFKFGTGNTDDEWFIYELQAGVSSGSWDFIGGSISNPKSKGGGLSHTNLYTLGSAPAVSIPEPGTLVLFGLGVIGLSISKKLKLRVIRNLPSGNA